MSSTSAAKAFVGVEEFLEVLNRSHQHPSLKVRELFDSTRSIEVARSPGRLDLMGGISDYSGSLVLEMPIREAAFVALQRRDDARVRVVTLDPSGSPATDGQAPRDRSFEMPASRFQSLLAEDYPAARQFFKSVPDTAWAAYIVGVLLVLAKEKGWAFGQGVSILVYSRVPEGKGVSSSAAIEVATLMAALGALGQKLEAAECATLCQKAENLVVGAPSGIMDQLATAAGEEGKLLEILCRPSEVEGSVALPEELCVWGVDSGVRHQVSGASYGQVRTAAFMGRQMIQSWRRREGARALDFLTEIEPSEWAQRYLHRVPPSLSGEAFLKEYGGTEDTVTQVEPASLYGVRAATEHPILEHFRVRCFRALLRATGGAGSTAAEGPSTKSNYRLLGELMLQSHASYSACGLGSDRTDLLVELTRARLPAGLLGAKITGGGSGGTVAILARRGSEAALEDLLDEYRRETGYAPYVFRGSSPGALQTGSLTLGPINL